MRKLGVALSCVLALAAAARAQDPGGTEYVAQRLQAIQPTLPATLKPGSTAARTYLYWQKAAGEIDICTDEPRLMRDRGRMRHTLGIGQPVKDAVLGMPTEGVDPQAVKSIRAVPKDIDDIHVLLIRLGPSGIKQVWDHLFDDPTGGKAAIGTIRGMYNTFHDMHEIGVTADADLEASRLALVQRYGFDLPKITVFTAQETGQGVLGMPLTPCILSVDPDNQPPASASEAETRKAILGVWKTDSPLQAREVITFKADGTADVGTSKSIWKYHFADSTHVVAVGGPSQYLKQSDIVWHRVSP